MKKKVVLIGLLLVIITILLIIPAPIRGGMLPGWPGEHNGLPACFCPMPVFWSCVCVQIN